jgi:hypothetical protein
MMGNIVYPWREKSLPLVSRSCAGGEAFTPEFGLFDVGLGPRTLSKPLGKHFPIPG